MRLYDEIFKSVDGLACQKYTVVIGGGGYFEGVKSVGDFSSEKIVIYFHRQVVEIYGIDLAIKKYYDGDLHVGGRVSAVRVVSPEENGGIK